MIIKENNTHKAVKEKDIINIFLKGMDFNSVDKNNNRIFKDEDKTLYPHWFKDNFLYSISLSEEDDLFTIFELIQENNRILVSNFKQEL